MNFKPMNDGEIKYFVVAKFVKEIKVVFKNGKYIISFTKP